MRGIGVAGCPCSQSESGGRFELFPARCSENDALGHQQTSALGLGNTWTSILRGQECEPQRLGKFSVDVPLPIEIWRPVGVDPKPGDRCQWPSSRRALCPCAFRQNDLNRRGASRRGASRRGANGPCPCPFARRVLHHDAGVRSGLPNGSHSCRHLGSLRHRELQCRCRARTKRMPARPTEARVMITLLNICVSSSPGSEILPNDIISPPT